MELRAGYMMTELGVIPVEWDAKTIGEIFAFYPTANYSKAEMAFSGEVGCIHYGLIHATSSTNLSLESGTKYYVPSNMQKYELVKDGDIIMVDASEDLSGINKSVEVFGVNNQKYIAGLHTFLLRDTHGILADLFRGQILNCRAVKDQMLKLAVGMKVFGVSKPQLRQIYFPLPPLPEQTAIAMALSDVDTLIAQTEKLIEKKKAIKQGVMQRLLSPYDQDGNLKEGWVRKRFGEYGKTYGGLTGKSKKDFGLGKAKYIPFMNIMSNPIIDITYLETVDVKSGEVQNKARGGDLFFNGSSETPQEVGMCSVLMEDVENLYLNSFCFGFRFSSVEVVNGLFLAYYFRSNMGRELLFSLAQGATRYNLSKTNLLKLELELPSKGEQDSIAHILENMDEELDKCSKILVKLQLQKQGMMQSLLTGKIRIYHPQHESATTL